MSKKKLKNIRGAWEKNKKSIWLIVLERDFHLNSSVHLYQHKPFYRSSAVQHIQK